MLWLNFLFIDSTKTHAQNTGGFVESVTQITPVFTFLTAIANLGLAIVVFSYTRRKNQKDIKIKWFQELIYTPNKETLTKFFDNLHNLKDKVPNDRNLTEEEKIAIMTQLKKERSAILLSFVNLTKPVAPKLYSIISKAIDGLIDELTKVFDNDELKLSNEKTYIREVSNRISNYRNEIIGALFNYDG